MIDKKLANQYGDVIAICKALKPHATNLLFTDSEGHVMLQPTLSGILNWAKLRDDEVEISSFVHTYMNIPEATSANTKFRKTKSDIDWIVKEGERYLVVKNPDGPDLEQPVITSYQSRDAFYQKIYKKLLNDNHYEGVLPLQDIPDGYFEELPMELCDMMVGKKLCEVTVGGHSFYMSRPFLGDLKKTEWLGACLIYIREPDAGEVTRKAFVYFKQREPLMEIYTYGAFLILEDD